MGTLKQIVGVILILIAAIVAIHTVIEPVYHTSTDESPNSPIWDIINPLTAIAIILGLIFGYCRMSRAGAKIRAVQSLSRRTRYSTDFCSQPYSFSGTASAISGVGKEFTAVGADVRSLVWIFFHALFPLLSGAMGVHLLRASASE